MAKCKQIPQCLNTLAKADIFVYNSGEQLGGERMLALEYRKLDGKDSHTAGRKLLQEMVEYHTQTSMPEISITQRGKPFFPDSNLHFSVSHTKHHVFCALSDKPIGIDAEELDRDIALPLADKILSPEEHIQYEAAADRRLALLTFWVLKEAAAKCTGEGLRGYPNRTDFSLDDPRVTQLGGCLVAVIEEEEHAL